MSELTNSQKISKILLVTFFVGIFGYVLGGFDVVIGCLGLFIGLIVSTIVVGNNARKKSVWS